MFQHGVVKVYADQVPKERLNAAYRVQSSLAEVWTTSLQQSPGSWQDLLPTGMTTDSFDTMNPRTFELVLSALGILNIFE